MTWLETAKGTVWILLDIEDTGMVLNQHVLHVIKLSKLLSPHHV